MASDTGSHTPASKGIMTFYPTMEEFQDFTRYIAYIESQGAHRAGLVKIVPPKEWKPRSTYDDIDNLMIPAPIQQVVTGQSGLFTQYNIQKKAMSVREFRKIANSDKFCGPRYDDFEELERKYWKNVTFNPPIYGADVNGTLYDPGVKEWNIGFLNTILDTVEHDSGITIEGVNTPYLYFGMWKTTFAWHTEDMDLYSINYLHFGEPKSWYCVPPEHGKRMERLAQGFFPGSAQNCEAFLRHKMTLISPSILKKYGIPFEKITQRAGEFMVTFPYAYHAGFNHGFNCAESTNFATQRWIEYGKQAVLCSCRKDMVKISMDVFVKKYQPHRYQQWLAGKDVGPIDHSRPTPEAKEFLGDDFNDITSSSSSCQESCVEEGERKSPIQRIETKRHRVCLEVPEEVVPKDEDEEEEQYGKRPRLSLMPARTVSPDCRRNKGPPKLVVTPTKLTLMDPFHRSWVQGNDRPPHYTKTRAPAILSQSQHRNGHLSVTAAPARDIATATTQPARKLGVASLLFHKTQSSKETLHVHSYSLDPQQQQHQQPHHTLLQVHSYAREHQPRHLQHKTHTPSQAQTPLPSYQESEPQPEHKIILSSREQQTQATGQSLGLPQQEVEEEDEEDEDEDDEDEEEEEENEEEEEEARAPPSQSLCAEPVHVLAKAEGEWPDAPSPSTHHPVTTPTQSQGAKRMQVESPKNSKRKVAEEQSYCKTVVTKQQQLQVELKKLPRQHPLLREPSSDDDVRVEMEPLRDEKEEWAKPLASLWQCCPLNLQAERAYNRQMGESAPYCCICSLFHTHHQLESDSGADGLKLVGHPGGRQWSKPLIPEMCFNTYTSKTNESGEGQLSNPRLEDDGTSRLVSCTRCFVRVHTSCYGVSGKGAELDDWLCSRCEADAMTEDCCLCSLRGGALQRANNGKWVHVLCAVTVLEARFVNITDRRPIDLSAIPLPRFRLKCFYCRKRIKQELTGCCVQCSHGRCSTAFHPTCAQAAGVLLYPDDWPFIVFVTCQRHRAAIIPERDKATLRDLQEGQRVICKHKNGRYYHSDVTELTTATFYEVVFDDGSYSDNLFPEDIENRDCLRLGPPAEGEAVQVRWTDGLIYGAKFVTSHSIPMYQVEFEDGSTISVKREDIYSLDEDLPKRVKSRMSVASDMRFEIFAEKEVKQNSKRQRVINSRYREDYIEPVVYRAIME